MADASDEEDYHFYGTELQNEQETRAGQHHKKVGDPSATRALPLHKQEVTDQQGRRRFHGAFTGGFSAGYFNTVGSKEGWQPGNFRSSRDQRAAVQQSVEQYLDEDELEDLRRTNLQTTADYDTFGSTAAELARRAAADAAVERPSAIPGLLPDELVVPVAESVGIRLLQKMGWRMGKGIGVVGDAPTIADEEAEEAAADGGAGRKRRWGQHASVAAENTQLYLLAPKADVHGLGYDPFRGAEDFRRLKQERRAAGRPARGTAEARKRRHGIAFGAGVLDEEDGYGQGVTLEDYVTHDDVGEYDDEVEAGGGPRSRAPKLRKGGLGDRLARQGYSFEIVDEEEDLPALEWHPSHPHRQQQYALPGREQALLLQTREQLQGKSGFVPGFVRATAPVAFPYFPPPRVPPGYVPQHRPSREADAALPAAGARFAPAPADPPADSDLRQAIDSLAFFVARHGALFENMARQRQQKEGRFAFLSGGEGAAYYRWKVHALRSIIQPQQQGRRQQRAIGQRSAPLSADERGALLGEQQLPGSQQSWSAGLPRGSAAAAAVAAGEPQQALRRQLMQVAEADRQRLQHLLTRNFVAAESQEMLQPDASAVAAGLRPGAPAPAPRPAAGAAAAAGPARGKIVTEADFSRPADTATAAPAVGPATDGSMGLVRPAAAGTAERRLPVRRSEEWRPLLLLCKRFNVPDPYHGRPAQLQMSKFRTDHLALPDTAAAVASTLAAVPAGAQEFLLPPTVAAAIQQAEAQQAQPGGTTGRPLPPPPQQQPQQQHGAQLAPDLQQQDASGAADAFLSSLADMLGPSAGGGSAAEAAPPLPEEEGMAAEAAAPAERPVDLFKAIFEDSEEEQEEEQEDDATEQQAGGGEGDGQHQGSTPGGAPQQVSQAAATDLGSNGRLQITQQQQAPPTAGEDASFGFAKLRQQGPTSHPSASAAAAAVRPAIAAVQGPGSLDEETKRRVEQALRVLKHNKNDKHGSKKKKRKKERSEKKSKDRKGRQDKGEKGRGKDKSRKERRHESSEGGNDSNGNSGNGSGSARDVD